MEEASEDVHVKRATQLGDEHLREVKDVLGANFTVLATTYPLLHAAFEAISHDCGAGAGHETYWVPDEWSPHVPDAEAALATLSAEERQTFAIGEHSEVEALANRSTALTMAHRMLNAFFGDFEQ